MNGVDRWLAALVVLLGIGSFVVGVIFVIQAFQKESWMVDAMRMEKVTLELPKERVERGDVIDTPEEAQRAGDTLREHRRGIAPTYDELLGGGRFDANNPQHITYAQALNMENYLYLAVLGFGVTLIAKGIGAFMIIVGVALGASGIGLYRLSSVEA